MPRQAPRPLVAVSATIREDAGIPRVRLTAAYLTVLHRVGLTPIVVAPAPESDADDAVAAILNEVHGLVLTGGEDVDPAYYGAQRSPLVERVNRARDTTELALVWGARDRRLPTLAICRGIQLLNVALGGTLIQDIPSERPGPIPHDQSAPRDQRTHSLHIESGSRIADAIGATSLVVNSVHHQAVDRVGEGLHVSALAPDGIIEGVETTADDQWWVMGVQWHPEEFVADMGAADHGIFRAFAAAVAAPERTFSRPAAIASRRAPAASAGRGNGSPGTDTYRSRG